VLKKQKNLISSKGCPPPSSKPPLRLPRTDGKIQRMIVATLAQMGRFREWLLHPSRRGVTSNLPLSSPSCPPYKSKKSGVSRYPSDPPHQKDQIFASENKEGYVW